MSNHLTREAVAEIEANFDNTREAFELLAIINAEFQTDPMSVQCFDSRVVERVRQCVGKRVAFVKRNPLAGERLSLPSGAGGAQDQTERKTDG